VTGMALAHCILGKLLGVVCHCFPPPLDVPTLTARYLRPASVRNDARDRSSERWNCGRERCPVVILPKFRLPRKFGDLLHAANLRHGTDGFISPPKEGVLRIFFALKIRRLRPGLNPQTISFLSTNRHYIILVLVCGVLWAKIGLLVSFLFPDNISLHRFVKPIILTLSC